MGYSALAQKHGYTQQQIATALGKSRVAITEALSLLEIPEDIREECRRADIDARSVLLEIARLGHPDRMREAIALVLGGSTREDLRVQKKVGASGKSKARSFHFVYRPKDGPYKLAISFDKSRVNRDELIGALRAVLKQLESGALELKRK
jgi:ParB-like chromosome segregation protein Spo0J